ncbi:hypothetical protein SLA2020_218120 [Shorea laevis]
MPLLSHFSLFQGCKLRRWASPTLEFWHFIFHRDGPSSDGGWFSWGSGGWFSFERVECKDLYQRYKECVNLHLEDREKDVYGTCSIFQDEFEESCGKKYKSLLSSWWTEKDEKRLCKWWSKFSEMQCKRSDRPPNDCKAFLLVAKRACRGIKLD